MQFHRTMTGALAFGVLAVTPFVASAQTTPAAPAQNPPSQGAPPQSSPSQGSPSQTGPSDQTGAQSTTKADIGQLAYALTNIDAQTSAVKGMSSVPMSSIQLVNATSLAKGKNAVALKNAVVKRDAQIQTLRQALSSVSVTDSANGNQNVSFTTALGNLSTTQKLDSPVTIDRVIAVSSLGNGPLTVFYQ